MNILVNTIRVYGFRGLQNVEVDLELVTVLTGMNNSGKTSLLKAMQIALGNKQFITQDDFYFSDKSSSVDEIIIDVKIVPINNKNEVIDDFGDIWETLFTEDRITISDDKSFVPLRTIVTYDKLKSTYKSKQYILPDWPSFGDDNVKYWYQFENGKERSFNYDEIPFFYVEAQRDILEDMKVKNSYLGKMISEIAYTKEDVLKIEKQIKELNEEAVNSSDILKNIKTTLKELDTAMDNTCDGVEITPFTKKIRDLSKGLSIYYSDKNNSFSMEYHGMGTRSWASLLTLKSFITLLNKNATREETPFFPIMAIEEPESHLHPNAQKKLYRQISEIKGQKIVSTHSPYIAASAELSQIRNFYKTDVTVGCGQINMDKLTNEDIRKIKRQVLNTRGELFFSRVIILSEGETEEQALTILAENYFDKKPMEMGINFVGVGGCNNYISFLRVIEALKIPWFIFSDAEMKVKEQVREQVNVYISNKTEDNVIVFLNDGNDFEQELISNGFCDEIKKVIKSLELPKCHSIEHKTAKTNEIEAYDNEKLYKFIKELKIPFAPLIAEAIIESNKPLPLKVTELFEKIKDCLERRVEDE